VSDKEKRVLTDADEESLLKATDVKEKRNIAWTGPQRVVLENRKGDAWEEMLRPGVSSEGRSSRQCTIQGPFIRGNKLG